MIIYEETSPPVIVGLSHVMFKDEQLTIDPLRFLGVPGGTVTEKQDG